MTCLLRLPHVLERTGLGRSTLYRLLAEGLFPPPVRIGRRAVAWRADDIQDWIESRPVAATVADGGHRDVAQDRG